MHGGGNGFLNQESIGSADIKKSWLGSFMQLPGVLWSVPSTYTVSRLHMRADFPRVLHGSMIDPFASVFASRQ